MSRIPNKPFDVAIWALSNPRAAVNLRRVAQACVDEGLRTVVFWSERPGRGGGRPENYPVPGLEFRLVPLLERLGPVRYPHPLILPLLAGAVRRALKQAAPRCLITQLDHGMVDRVWQHAAKQERIPGMVLQEGMANVPKFLPANLSPDRLRRWTWIKPRGHKRWFGHIPHPLLQTVAPYMFADYACVWGEIMRRHLVRLGRRPETIFVTGSPAFDDVVARAPLVSVKGKTLLYAQQPMSLPLAERQPFYEHLIRATVALGCRLLFKLHPNSTHEAGLVRELVGRTPGASPFVEVFDTNDSVDLLKRATVLVSASSTTCYHAAIAGVPLVIIDYLSRDIRFDLGESGGAAIVTQAKDLKETLRRALDEVSFRKRLYEGAQRMIEDHLHLLDGRAAERGALVAKQLAESAAGRIQDHFTH